METAPSQETRSQGLLVIGIAGSDAATVIYMLRSILDAEDPYGHAGTLCSLETFDGVEQHTGWRGSPTEKELVLRRAHAQTAGLGYLLAELPSSADACAGELDILCSLEAGRCAMSDGRVITFAPGDPSADVWGDGERCSLGVVSFAAHTPTWTWRIAFPVPGAFNEACALAAIAVCVELGIEPARIVERFFYVRVPGRMELLLTPDHSVVGIVDCACDGPSYQRFFSAVFREFDGYRMIAVVGKTLGLGEGLPFGLVTVDPSGTRRVDVDTAVRLAYTGGEAAVVCLLGSCGNPVLAQADADIFNEAVRQYSPGLWTKSM